MAGYLRSRAQLDDPQGPASRFERLRSSHPSIAERLEALERASAASGLKNSP